MYVRLMVLSAHYNTQLGVMSALGQDTYAGSKDNLWFSTIPNWASTLVLELHQEPGSSNYAVRMVQQVGRVAGGWCVVLLGRVAGRWRLACALVVWQHRPGSSTGRVAAAPEPLSLQTERGAAAAQAGQQQHRHRPGSSSCGICTVQQVGCRLQAAGWGVVLPVVLEL
jgi:hypothetical protein